MADNPQGNPLRAQGMQFGNPEGFQTPHQYWAGYPQGESFKRILGVVP